MRALCLFALVACSSPAQRTAFEADAADLASYPCCQGQGLTVPCAPDDAGSHTGVLATCHPDGCLVGSVVGTQVSCPLCSTPSPGACSDYLSVDGNQSTGLILSGIFGDAGVSCVCGVGAQCATSDAGQVCL